MPFVRINRLQNNVMATPGRHLRADLECDRRRAFDERTIDDAEYGERIGGREL